MFDLYKQRVGAICTFTVHFMGLSLCLASCCFLYLDMVLKGSVTENCLSKVIQMWLVAV